MKLTLAKNVEIPVGVNVSIVDDIITVKGPKGEVSKRCKHLNVRFAVEGNELTIQSDKATKREKTIVFTFRAHLKNMIQGVMEPHIYTLKVCSGHFPMTVVTKGNEFSVKNFLGEKVPRVLPLKEGAEVKVNGQEIIVTSVDIEKAGQVAADIELLCRITNRDRRIFQDGIWITSKPHKGTL